MVESKRLKDLLALMNPYNFSFIFRENTRMTSDKMSGTCIDNMFTNIKGNLEDSEVIILPKSFSDHTAQKISIFVPEKIRLLCHTVRKRMINAETLFILNSLLESEKWEEVYNSEDPSHACEEFISAFRHYLDIACPTKDKKQKPRQHKKVIWNSNVESFKTILD